MDLLAVACGRILTRDAAVGGRELAVCVGRLLLLNRQRTNSKLWTDCAPVAETAVRTSTGRPEHTQTARMVSGAGVVRYTRRFQSRTTTYTLTTAIARYGTSTKDAERGESAGPQLLGSRLSGSAASATMP